MKKDHRFIQKANKKRQPDLEYPIHCQIADYLTIVIKRPSSWMTIEVSNQQSGVAGMIKQSMLKRKGVKTGTPDIQIIWCSRYGWKIIFLEVKIPSGNLTEKQEALHKELREDGHEVHIVHSVEETVSILKSLGVI